MGQILKLDEWQGASKHWYVADVHTWTGWRECADVFDVESLDDYIKLLETIYKATVHGTMGIVNNEPANVIFSWAPNEYKNAHRFKLDVNRIARKKSYMVE